MGLDKKKERHVPAPHTFRSSFPDELQSLHYGRSTLEPERHTIIPSTKYLYVSGVI